ncbi:hypothetical protein BKA56DRAFT_669369 [Ilyonectria sp. MPI-CAGE-AT-0026]|nr:hypothetical protein BKA56DRAFT_669369 [Ilyonectria sp. MPI-CAGE-AT-0026]
MPCCIAIIHFAQCSHSTLFKLGCTAHCDALCPAADQRTLVVTRYLWSCEDCHMRQWLANDDLRSAAWTARTEALEEDRGLPVEARAVLFDMLRCREQYEDNRLETARQLQVEEIQWVAEWTLEYGLMVWDALYERRYGPRAARRRIKQLRALRLWDLVVTRDALRGGKELRQEQVSRSTWIGAENRSPQQNQGSQRKELPRLPTLNGPAPIFRAEDLEMLEMEPSEDEQEREAQDLMDVDESGDVMMDADSPYDFNPA